MGLFDFLGLGDSSGNQPQSSDPTGAYLGNLIDPATAQQFQQARAQQALAGLSAGLLAGSGPSRLPIPFGSALAQGLQGMMQQQNALPGQALQAAQTQNQVGDAQYKKLQGLGLLQNMQFLNQQAQAAQRAYGDGGNATSTNTLNPTSAPANSGDQTFSGDYADKVVGAELGGAPNDAKNPRSSATGPGQFTDATWKDLYRRNFPSAASIGDNDILTLRTDPDTAKLMVNAYARDNGAILAQAGIPINDATLYSAHFLGPDGAVKVLTAPANTPLASLLSPKAMAANPNLKGKTAADFASMMSSKMGVNSAVGSAYAAGSGAPRLPTQLASVNGSANPANAAFLAQAFGTPGTAQTGPLAASPGQAAAPSGGMPLPPGMTPDQVNAARLANSFAAMRGGQPDPYLAKIGVYGPEAALAAASANAQQAARAGYAGVRAFNTKAGEAPFNFDQTVTIPDGNGGLREVRVPLTTYMQMLQQQGLMGGSQGPGSGSSMPPTVPSMPGTNLAPGGPIGVPNTPPQTPQTPPQGGLVPGGAMPGLQRPPVAAGGPSLPSGGNPASVAPGAPTGSVPSPTAGVPLIGKPILAPTAKFDPFAYRFAPNVGQGPGQNEPIIVNPSPQRPYPSVIPPLSEMPAMTGSETSHTKDQENWSKTTGQWATATSAIPEALQRVDALAQIMKKYETGSYAQHFSDFLADLRAAGVRVPEGTANDPAKAQEILKNNFGEALAIMKATGIPRWTQAELMASQKNFANTDLQPTANFEILSQLKGRLYQQNAMIQDWAAAKNQGWPDPNAFEQQWLAKNPLQAYIDIAKVQMGPLAGMTNEDFKSAMPKTKTANGQRFVQSGGRWYPAGATQ